MAGFRSSNSVNPSGALSRAFQNFSQLLHRVRTDARLRGEAGWIVAYKLGEFVLIFATLKCLTGLLGREGYGEYNLVLTALMLISNALIAPMNRAYLRHFHHAEAAHQGRSAGLTLLVWYGVVTLFIALGAMAFTGHFSRWFGLGAWTTCAAGFYFLGNRWRMLGTEVLNIRRARRTYAVHGLGFQFGQLILAVLVIVTWQRSAGAALIGSAVAALACGALVAVPLVKRILNYGPGEKSALLSLVRSFGVPFGAMLVLQWVQLNAERYILKALLDFESAGAYIAAYQVCGAPFMLALGALDLLLLPVAYRRARNIEAPRELWSADRLLLGGVAAYLAMGIPVVAVFLFWGPELVVLLTSREFTLGTWTIFLLACGRYIQCLTLVLQMIFAVHQCIGRLLLIRVIGAAITVPICWVAVSWYGVFGAALGMSLAVLTYCLALVFGPGGCVPIIMKNRRRLLAEQS